MPTKADIITAVKNSNIFLKVPELGGAAVKLNSNGTPYLFTGGFTMVFQLTKGLEKWAFRVWHCGFNRQKERFRKISQYLVSKELPYFANFIYDEKGLLVNGEFVDTIRMEWLEGDLLKNYIEKNIDNPDELRLLAAAFLEMFNSLHEQNISHGDLQHGNILIDEYGNIQLIDYDSVCVPDIEGYEELVTGLKGYQHPSRLNNATKASLKADYFSELIIYLSLCAIAENPNLWDKYNVSDTEVLLFNDSDIENIQQSNIYKELSDSESKTIKSLLKILVDYLNEESYLNLKPFSTHKDFIESWDIQPKPVSKCHRCGKQINFSMSGTICERCQLEEINLKNLLQKREDADSIIARAELKYNKNLTDSSKEALIEALAKLKIARDGKDIAAIDAAITEVEDAIEAAILKKQSWGWAKRILVVLLLILAGIYINFLVSKYKSDPVVGPPEDERIDEQPPIVEVNPPENGKAKPKPPSPGPQKGHKDTIPVAAPVYSAMSWYQEGVKNSNAGNYSKAIRCYNNALAMNPYMSNAWYNLGIAYEWEQKKSEALECYQKAVQFGHKDAQERLKLLKGENGGVVDESEQKLVVPPVYSAMSWYKEGVKNSNAGNYSDAIRCFRNALNMNPKLYNAWNGLANVYYLQGNYDNAINCFQESNNITYNGSAWYGMGLSYAKKNNHSKAMECLKKAAQLEHKEAQKLLKEMNKTW